MGIATAALLCSVLAACASSAQQAREQAADAVRSKALSLREDLAAAARGTSGAAQLAAVRQALPDVPLTAEPDGDGVVVSGAITARSEAGGGLWYEQSVARVCLAYRIEPGSGRTDVRDAACPADVDSRAPADRDVPLSG